MTAPRGPRYGFVVPRFGERCGGAENLVGALARELVLRGVDAEVIATCAADNRTWENELPPGVTEEQGITVRRFPVSPRNLERWIPLQLRLHDGVRLDLDEQLDWMAESVNSQYLYEYLVREGDRYDLLFFAPYLFGTTFWGSLIHPEKSVLIPCLHDEAYAHLDVVASMFRQVAGCLFNAAPEGELCRELYGPIPGGEVGMGFKPVPRSEAAALTKLPGVPEKYLLYLGRKETGKNVPWLIDAFIEGKANGFIPTDLSLVICGGGSFSDLHRPNALTRDDIIDVQHLSEDEKKCLLKYATALVQPSLMESFSIVIMEAWLLEVPVIVHADCRVTRAHVIDSGGGLLAADSAELGVGARTIVNDPMLRTELGRYGRRYVEERYSWEAVIARFHEVVARISASRAHVQA